MAVATDVGYGPVLLTLLSAPVVGVVAAVHSGEILGRTHSQNVSMPTQHPRERQ
ncbi:hypothetical protein ACIRVF_22490 [Kitasatospora sp. NPDC101157]|uniref:hypothetical protein n=1 Tax=Kitasatospora sp. NPDC101157 TaxID=3364098 RepID=UPI00380E97BF